MPWPKGKSRLGLFSDEHRANLRAACLRSWADPARRERTVFKPPEMTLELRVKLSRRMMGNTSARDASVKGECVYCGSPATERDHPIPSEPETVLACRRCNASKSGRTPEEWLAAGLYASDREPLWKRVEVA